MMKTVKQLLKEYWIPFTVACVWAVINFYKKESNTLSFVNVDIINIFGASFILVSWFSEQYFRITGQAKVEDNLEKIEKRANDIFDNLEARTSLIFSQISGGNSFCYVGITENYLGRSLTVQHQGDYPLYDLTIRVVDLDKFNAHSANPKATRDYEKRFSIGTMLPKHFSDLCTVSLSEEECSKRFNIFFYARNGMFHEQLRLKKENNEWLSAIKVDRDKTLLESVSENYPKNMSGEVDW